MFDKLGRPLRFPFAVWNKNGKLLGKIMAENKIAAMNTAHNLWGNQVGDVTGKNENFQYTK